MSGLAGKEPVWWKDAAERIVWTATEAGLATAAVLAGDLEPWLAVPIATGLAAIKTWAAQYWGDPRDASITGSRKAR